MKTLEEIMYEKGSDKSYIHHKYTDNYAQWFEPYRNLPLTILEVGVGGEDTHLGGYSLLGWEEYFPYSKIYGIDIYDKSELNKGRIKTFQGSQDDPVFLQSVIDEIGSPDIIIDDGSHVGKLTIASFDILFPLLKDKGLYIIEDTFCAYRWDFGGDLNLNTISSPTIMNHMLMMSHYLQRIEVADQHYKRPLIVEQIECIQFYKSLIKIHKK
jgi:demethylmacrocin O-methyltransferase